MTRITIEQSKRVGKKLNVNFDIIDVKTLQTGINIEMEHSNITKGSITLSAKIALAHLEEFPDYYQELIKMEKKLKQKWKGKRKPNIYN
jgi:hypothetical protein